MEDSQSDVEMETVCSILLESTRNLQSIKNSPQHLQQLDGAMNVCSENINLLNNLTPSFNEPNSFINKKKNREARLLLGKWEQLMESLNQEKILQQNLQSIRDKAATLRARLSGLAGETRESSSPSSSVQASLGDREVDGNLRRINNQLHKYKDNLVSLAGLKDEISALSLNLHSLKAQAGARKSQSSAHDRVSFPADSLLATSNDRASFSEVSGEDCKTEDPLHNEEILKIQENISDLYSLWEDCHYSTTSAISSAEETQAKLEVFAAELCSLRSSLRRDAQRRRGSSREGSSDSGISDGSSEPEFGLMKCQLERLRQLGSQLEAQLDSGTRDLIARTLETTSFQLRDLRINSSKSRLKVGGGRRPSANQTKRQQPKQLGASSWRRRVFKMAALVHVVGMVLMLVSWLVQPRCCDSIGSMSLVPELKYVNGPPPI